MGVDRFSKGDYIVTLRMSGSTKCGKDNYIFKIKDECEGIAPEIDLKGSNTNRNNNLTPNKEKDLHNWRYATEVEIEEYERLGKPFDVTTIDEYYTMNDLLDKLDELETKLSKDVC